MTVLTGPAASVGSEQRNWAKLAVDEFNKAGGVGGVQVELVDGDTEFDPAKSVLVGDRLAADSAVVADRRPGEQPELRRGRRGL